MILFQCPWALRDFARPDITDFADGEILEDSNDIYQNIWSDWICSDKYTYKHVWKSGDIMLMDLLTTIQTSRCPKDKPRIVMTACWYKGEVRKHLIMYYRGK